MPVEVVLETGFKVALDTSEDAERRHRELRKQLSRSAGYRALSAGAASIAGQLLLDFGAPPAGKMYVAQWLTVFGDTPFGAAIANVSAALCAGLPHGQSGSGLTYSQADVIQAALPVPANVNLPDDAIAHGGQHLYVVLAGSGLPGTIVNFNANCGVLIADDDPETVAWV